MNNYLAKIGLSTSLLTKIGITIAIIVSVFILAKIISSLLGKGLTKANFLKKLFKFVDVDLDMKKIGSISEKIFYYLILLLGIVGGLAYFNVIEKTALNSLIDNYLMNFLNAAGLAIIAWFLAVLAKATITKGAKTINLDKQISEDNSEISLSEIIGTIGYWAVIIFFLPQILAKLNQEELLKPITNIIDNVTGYIPNIIGATLIFVIGYFIAKVIRQITTSVLASIGTDKATEKIGLKDFSVSKMAGTLAYIVVLLPVSIQALDKLKIEVISGPATKMLQTMMDAIPLILTASIIIAVSYFIGKFIAKLVSDLLSGIGFDKVLGLIGLKNVESKTTPSTVVGTIVFSYILLLASVEAANAIGFNGISSIVNNILAFATNILIGVMILGIGMYIANLVSDMIKSTSKSKILPLIAKSAIIILTGFMGLRQMGIGGEIIDQAFTLILGSIAVAFALAVGLGSKEIAGEEVKKLIKKLKK